MLFARLVFIIGLSASLFMLFCSAHAFADDIKYVNEGAEIFLSLKGKQITPAEAYRSDQPVYDCQLKEIKYNKRTGKPSMKKVD